MCVCVFYICVHSPWASVMSIWSCKTSLSEITSTLKSSICWSLPLQPPQGIHYRSAPTISCWSPPQQKSCYKVECFRVVRLALLFMDLLCLFSPKWTLKEGIQMLSCFVSRFSTGTRAPRKGAKVGLGFWEVWKDKMTRKRKRCQLPLSYYPTPLKLNMSPQKGLF